MWEPVCGVLHHQGVANVRPDLLGFGASRSIGTTFTLDDHVTAVSRLLDTTGARCMVVVAHSFGCAPAVELAIRDPARVRELVLALTLVCPLAGTPGYDW